MKKIKLHLIGRLNGDYIVQEVTGELFQGEIDDKGALALVHLTKKDEGSVVKKSGWQMINIYTGLLVSKGSTKQKCIDDFEACRARYKEILKNDDFMVMQHKRLDDMLSAQ